MSKAKKATRKTLARIDACLATLRDEVSAIRQDTGSPRGRQASQWTGTRSIEFLDRYRAGEAMAATGLGAWIAASDTPGLRGSLRAIQLREAYHARLFEERIKELGGSPEGRGRGRRGLHPELR